MAQQLVRGANTTLSTRTVRIRVLAPYPLDLTALLVDPGLRVREDADLVFWNARARAGVRWEAGGAVGYPATLAADLDAVPADVESVLAVLSLPEEAAGMLGSLAAPVVRVEAYDGTSLVEFTVDGMTTERAVLSVELYRRGSGWKVRAVGQGYAGGLPELLAVHGVEVDEPTPAARPVPDSARGPVVGTLPGYLPPGAPPRPEPAGPAAGPAAAAPAASSSRDLPYTDRVWLVWEDACRALAGYRSSAEHALIVRDGEHTGRTPAGRHQEILTAARRRLDADVTQLGAELDRYAPTVPAELAPWESPSWLTWRPTGRLVDGLLVGHLSPPEAPTLRVPLILRLPLFRALWISHGPMPTDSAALAWSLVTRLVAAVPAGSIGVEVIDPSGLGGLGWLHSLPQQVVERVLAGGVAAGPEQAGARLGRLLDLVDLRTIGADEDAAAILGGPALRLVVVDDPIGVTGTDEALANRLLRLIEDGPAVGVAVLCLDTSGDVDSSVLALRIRQACQGLPSGSGSIVGDPWVRSDWAFEPEVLPDASLVAAGAGARAPALLGHVFGAHTGG
jgi:stress response protein SCP2